MASARGSLPAGPGVRGHFWLGRGCGGRFRLGQGARGSHFRLGGGVRGSLPAAGGCGVASGWAGVCGVVSDRAGDAGVTSGRARGCGVTSGRAGGCGVTSGWPGARGASVLGRVAQTLGPGPGGQRVAVREAGHLPRRRGRLHLRFPCGKARTPALEGASGGAEGLRAVSAAFRLDPVGSQPGPSSALPLPVLPRLAGWGLPPESPQTAGWGLFTPEGLDNVLLLTHTYTL